jgi:hypothetical protein
VDEMLQVEPRRQRSLDYGTLDVRCKKGKPEDAPQIGRGLRCSNDRLALGVLGNHRMRAPQGCNQRGGHCQTKRTV